MNISPYLPSRKIRIVLLTILILGLAYGIYFLITTLTQQSSESEQEFIDVALVNSDTQNLEYYKDTDNDGAYDWEEALWPELDPNNPDSDGDGILDGKYIKTKQDIQERERRGLELPTSNLSETEKLGRSTLVALLAIAESGDTLDEVNQQKFSENISEYIRELTLGEKVYTRDQLILVDDTQETIDAYRENMKRLFKQYPIAATDIELLLKASENPSNYQTELKIAVDKYRSYLEKLLLMETPRIIAGRHNELVNNISQINGGLVNLASEESDDLTSFALLIQMEKILNQTAEALININLFFEITEDESLLAG